MNASEALDNIAAEYIRASNTFPKFNSAHEGYAVLLEEVDELWEAIKTNQKESQRIIRITDEAIQVAAMAMRILVDCGYQSSTPTTKTVKEDEVCFPTKNRDGFALSSTNELRGSASKANNSPEADFTQGGV